MKEADLPVSPETPKINSESQENQKELSPGRATGHRIFTNTEKKQCWNQSAQMIGRDAERWRMDAYGIPVMNALRGCMGLFCHEYDHIIPYSKGGMTQVNNCQVLQTKLNREKSNRTDVTFSELRNFVPPYSYSELEMDIIERAVYGDVRKPTLHDFVNKNNEEKNKK